MPRAVTAHPRHTPTQTPNPHPRPAARAQCVAADAAATIGWGFDSIKLDGCGKELAPQLWYDSLEWAIAQAPNGTTGGGFKGVLVENCHNGGGPQNQPSPGFCPFHMYRSSTDIRPVYASLVLNLLTVPPLAEANLSYPGCW